MREEREPSYVLIQAQQVGENKLADSASNLYEFIVDHNLDISQVNCVFPDNKIRIIKTFHLSNELFELRHVRINPYQDNTFILDTLTDTLLDIGVKISNRPQYNQLAICFKPLGELMGTVRFYVDKRNKMVFLSTSYRPKLLIRS